MIVNEIILSTRQVFRQAIQQVLPDGLSEETQCAPGLRPVGFFKNSVTKYSWVSTEKKFKKNLDFFTFFRISVCSLIDIAHTGTFSTTLVNPQK